MDGGRGKDRFSTTVGSSFGEKGAIYTSQVWLFAFAQINLVPRMCYNKKKNPRFLRN